MSLPYASILTAVQHLTPTWRKPQQVGLADLVTALFDRPSLCLAELARSLPPADRPLHGRIKRLGRWLSNPRLDELALTQRWLKLSYHFASEPPVLSDDPRPLLPLLGDTTYFGPFAGLLATVPCGSRGLPVALTTYHRRELTACFPPRASWPAPVGATVPPRRGRSGRPPAAALVQRYASQNRIEEQFFALVQHHVSPGLRPVFVLDRGFARAALFRCLRRRRVDFVIRIDAETHVQVPPTAPWQPAAQALALAPGECRWYPEGRYGADARVPVGLLAVWDPGQEQPWFLATTLPEPAAAATLYRWRMRTETTHRDAKTGVLLREGDDHHTLTQPLHLHRLLLALATALWLCALVGLQAWQDLPQGPAVAEDLPRVSPEAPLPEAYWTAGPALPPPVQPHRPGSSPPPTWMRRFAVRGWLSYVRLGLEVLRAPDLTELVRRVVRWLGFHLWPTVPLWRPRQARYRRLHWWPDAA